MKNYMGSSIVSVKNLSHRYSVQWAIKDISFDITKKGVMGLLGSNGAGKSTTMNIICGVLNQTEGEVFINGINLRENPVEAKRYIGFLPQQPPLYTDLTVEEYLRNAAHLRLMEKSEVNKAVDVALRALFYFSFPESVDQKFIRGVPTTGWDCTGYRA